MYTGGGYAESQCVDTMPLGIVTKCVEQYVRNPSYALSVRGGWGTSGVSP
jgi:hypothetical protein